MFDEILKKVELGYDRCPAYKTLSTEMRPVFNRFVSCILPSLSSFDRQQNPESMSSSVSQKEPLITLSRIRIFVAQQANYSDSSSPTTSFPRVMQKTTRCRYACLCIPGIRYALNRYVTSKVVAS